MRWAGKALITFTDTSTPPKGVKVESPAPHEGGCNFMMLLIVCSPYSKPGSATGVTAKNAQCM